MDRLTKKINNPCLSNDYEMLCAHEYHILNKLGKLEDLEEELGCPLEILFKAVLRWIYYEDTTGNIIRNFVDLHTTLDGEYVLLCDNSEEVFSTKDYKKTWWLKKDKSE